MTPEPDDVPPPVDVPPPLAELSGAVAGVAKAVMGLSDLPDQLPYPDADAVLDSTVALDEEITRLQAVRAHLLRRIDVTKAYRARGFVTTASWYREATRRDHGASSRHVRSARRLGDLPQLAAALDGAEVTLDHVDVVSRACKPGRSDAITAADGILTDLARGARPREVRVACRRIADLVDRDGSEPADQDSNRGADADRETDTEEGSTGADACTGSSDGATSDAGGSRDPERGLWLHRSFDGRWRLEAELDAVAGERLFNLLNHLDERDDPDVDPVHRRSHPQRRHDAFALMIRGAEELPDLPTRHGARPRVLLIIDLLTLLGHDACASRKTRLGSGGVVGRDAALELLREATVTPVLQMGPYRSVAVGRTHRTLPDWLRPLLAATHRQCRGPGCDRPIAWTQAAHLDAWIENGNTDLDRTLPACTAHHQLMDNHGWRVEFDADTGRVDWTRSDGGYRHTTDPPHP